MNKEVKRQRNNEHKTDRLSSLPEEVLIKIISLLSLKVAVKTSILSRYWRHLWTQTTSLILDDLAFDGHSTNFLLTVKKVQHILQQLSSPKITTIGFCNRGYASFASLEIISMLFDHIRDRDIEVIKLQITNYLQKQSTAITLPSWVFECQSLVELELKGDCSWVEDIEIFCPNLPNLQKLSVTVNCLTMLSKILKSSLSLEELNLVLDCDLDSLIVDIPCPNLKHLHIDMKFRPSGRGQVVIDAPKLSTIGFKDCRSSFSFVNDLCPLLIKADIERTFRFHNNFTSSDLKLLRKLTRSRIRYLKLRCSSKLYRKLYSMLYDENSSRVFRDLLHLTVDIIDDRYWNGLMDFLRFISKVEVLVVYFLHWIRATGSLISRSMNKLKKVELWFPVEGCNIEVVECFLRKASQLKKLVIFAPYCSPSKTILDDQLLNEQVLCKKLFKLPRSSPTCEIVFHGVCINYASSNDFERGKLSLYESHN